MELREALAEIDRLAKITDEMCDTIHGLEARAEAADAKLARVLEMLKPDGPPIPGGMFDKENRFYYRYGKALHAHAVAIAEGRDDE